MTNSLNIVSRPSQAPGYCLATLSSEDREGFIDTGHDPAVVDPRVYISISWIREMAGKLGMVDQEELENLVRENSRLSDELREADKLVEAAEYTFSHMGTKMRQKPGPKKLGKDV